jgi:putative hydrolase of the HAD superfamily
MVKNIFFDADDTLWDNHLKFLGLMKFFFAEISAVSGAEEAALEKEFYRLQKYYLENYGYGLINFLPALVTLWAQRNNALPMNGRMVSAIIEFREEMLGKPPEILPGTRQVLRELKKKFNLYLLTKGNYREQHIKIVNSGLAEFFTEIFLVPEKSGGVYCLITGKLGLNPAECAMVGNSLKSDILPALECGWSGYHFVREENWAFEIPRGFENQRVYSEIYSLDELVREHKKA